MATDAGYAKYVCDQLQHAGGMSARKMFGEYGLYRHGKIVALICDNQLFVKPTAVGEAVLGQPTLGSPYPGAKPFFNVSDLLDDPDALVRLILATDAALPAPKPKAKRATQSATARGTGPVKQSVKKSVKPSGKTSMKKSVKKSVKKSTKKPTTQRAKKPA